MKLPLHRCLVLSRSVALAVVTWVGLGCQLGAAGCDVDVNLAAMPQAVAGCEAPTDDELVPEPPMLPGRDCMVCHSATGQASHLPWTAAGTVFDSPTASCNTHGVEGVRVDIVEAVSRKILITLYTNRTGNFFTSEPIDTSAFVARVTKGDKMMEMQTTQSTGECTSCHTPTGIAGGRIYLPN